jgi:hypothetical protein
MKGKYMRRIGGIVLGALMLFGVTLATAADTQAQSRRRRVVIVRPNPYRIYRPFGFGSRDWWYYRHFGYDPFGYDPWSPYGFRYRQYVFDNSNEAVEKGYDRGFKTGKDDGKKAKSFSPERSHYFKEAGFGNFAEFYRNGFSRGYGEGYKAGADERARKNAG